MKANRTVRDFEVALMNLLLTTSFERITVDQICDEALLHRSSFYRYFHDKYDLLEQALGAWVERIVDQTATEDDLIEALVSQIEANRAMFSNLANGDAEFLFGRVDPDDCRDLTGPAPDAEPKYDRGRPQEGGEPGNAGLRLERGNHGRLLLVARKQLPRPESRGRHLHQAVGARPGPIVSNQNQLRERKDQCGK